MCAVLSGVSFENRGLNVEPPQPFGRYINVKVLQQTDQDGAQRPCQTITRVLFNFSIFILFPGKNGRKDLFHI